jgi:hypothetical protein
MSTVATATAGLRDVSRFVKRPRFYVAITAFMSMVVLVGFWPSYFGPLLHGVADRPWMIQVTQTEPWLRMARAFLAAVRRLECRLKPATTCEQKCWTPLANTTKMSEPF